MTSELQSYEHSPSHYHRCHGPPPPLLFSLSSENWRLNRLPVTTPQKHKNWNTTSFSNSRRSRNASSLSLRNHYTIVYCRLRTFTPRIPVQARDYCARRQPHPPDNLSTHRAHSWLEECRMNILRHVPPPSSG